MNFVKMFFYSFVPAVALADVLLFISDGTIEIWVWPFLTIVNVFALLFLRVIISNHRDKIRAERGMMERERKIKAVQQTQEEWVMLYKAGKVKWDDLDNMYNGRGL